MSKKYWRTIVQVAIVALLVLGLPAGAQFPDHLVERPMPSPDPPVKAPQDPFTGGAGEPAFPPRSYGQPIAIEATLERSFALVDNGELWGWGVNWGGQLGDSTRIARNVPVRVIGIDNAALVSANVYHTLALLRDGRVMAWGFNGYGHLGDGTRTDQLQPVEVHDLPTGRVIDVVAETPCSLALIEDGTVWAWGGDNAGQALVPPRMLSGLSGITAIAHGPLALRRDGSVLDFENKCYRAPEVVPGLPNIRAIAGTGSTSFALGNDGSVWAWGFNAFGMLGTGRPITPPGEGAGPTDPVRILSDYQVTAIEAGARNAAAITQGGEVVIWGANYNGQYGNGTRWPDNTTPSQHATDPIMVPQFSGISAVAVGHPQVLALGTGWCGNKLWSWGRNAEGALGNGSQPDVWQERPGPVDRISGRRLRPLCAEISVAKSGSGRGSIISSSGGIQCRANCVEDYETAIFGTTITLSATPAPDSNFVGWSGNCAGTSQTVAIQARGLQRCEATFSESAD